MDVFIAKNGKTSGPFTAYQIRGKYDRGTLLPEDHIWYEGATEWMPAAWIVEWKEFAKATEEQKRAIYFLGGRLGRGLMLLDADGRIEQMATEQGRHRELSAWRARLPKLLELENWYASKKEQFLIPGGLEAMEARLAEIQARDPAAVLTVTAEEIFNSIEHYIRHDDWRDYPATEKQIRYLESVDIFVWPDMTKGEASALISPASDAQLRRLGFYGVSLPPYLSKQDASELIDGYIKKHPESEEQYQQWKQENGYPPSRRMGEGDASR